ncbi:hypothetical protein GYMLUDRAFT_46067 [Collybiopsis luxurians FD-317 M1]|uniref:Unplaced genomic scaffold GYMLUscaffold_42, whole genome shotgun sequence n=1 Tax=Collybiopsis luxurians FD-317 M1 TaxID=944289 RepID=A0A0D0C507_9AGAR|nr:hypothetical protein GYMLUDRAFT_46067 [Collybiopsis luxurians FD-317 M1]
MNFQHVPPPQFFTPPTAYYQPPNNYSYPAIHDQPVYYPPSHPFPPGYPLLRTRNGWFVQPPLPAPTGDVIYESNRQPSPSDPSFARQVPWIHAHWKGRIAPLPGFASSPDMLSQNSRAIEIKKETIEAQNNPPKTPPGLSKVADIDESASFLLDKYAEVFVPQFLQEIQKQPQAFEPLPPSLVFPSSLYSKSFLPLFIFEKLANLYSSTVLTSSPPDKAALCPPLNTEEYTRHWNFLLSWELDQLVTDIQKIILWQVRVRVLDWDNSDFFVLVPGIRENYPRLDIGDIIHLREVLVEWKVGSGIAFEGRVSRLRKREGFIHFHCPGLRRHIETYVPAAPGRESALGLPIYKTDEEIPPVFNLSFLTNARPTIIMDTATSVIGGTLLSSEKRDVAHRWLFPEPDDLHLHPPIPSTPPNISGEFWIDSGLNAEQRFAATSISTYQSPVPFLISGPPGTGKTRTVVESVHQILRTQPEAHILLCAPSNPATDTLAQRLGTSLKPGEMLRLNDQNRTFAEVPDSIRQFCYVENDSFALPPWRSVMNYRVVVTSCLDANILVEALCTNAALCMLEEHTMTSLHPRRKIKHQIVPHWTHLIIDEAAQGPEPELLVPISVVVTKAELFGNNQPNGENSNGTTSYNYHPLLTTPQLVLCGDPHQLGPIITSQEARTNELDVSLLERLIERPLYSEHADARHARRHLPLTGLPLHQKPLYSGFKAFVNLVKNYRSHPAILMPPSAMFYNDSLEPCARNGLISWAGLSNNKFPLMFLGCDTKDESMDERATWFNTGEIDRVVEVITSLMSEASKSFPPLAIDEIGVMAPWREQVWKIREKLRQAGLSRVDVGTVEDYQGREKRVVIISCVRSSGRFLKEDGQKGIGLVFEKKRMNVAITRAKELLVIIGNGHLLKCDPYWKGFLQFALRNNLYVGPDINIEDDGAWISRLESQIAEAEEENGLSPIDHTGMRSTMMLAGTIVRETLREDF